MTSAERIGAWLKHWRQHRGLTQMQLGEQIGSDGSRISKLENGLENPTVETLDQLLTVLKIDLSDLTQPRPEGETEGELRLQGSAVLDRLVADSATHDGTWQADVAQAIVLLGGALKRDRDRGTGDSEAAASRRGTAADR